MGQVQDTSGGLKTYLNYVGYSSLIIIVIMLIFGGRNYILYLALLAILAWAIIYGKKDGAEKLRYMPHVGEYESTIMLEASVKRQVAGESTPGKFREGIQGSLKKIEHGFPLTISPEPRVLDPKDMNLFQALKSAIDLYSDIMDRDDVYAEALIVLGNFHFYMGNQDKALDMYEKSLKVESIPAAWFNKGMQEHILKKYADAIVSYEKAANIAPDMWGASFYMGEALMAVGRFEEAKEAIQKALEVEPERPMILVAMGQILERLGRFEESLETFERVIKLAPEDTAVNYYKANVLTKMERHHDAIIAYEKALEKDNRLSHAWAAKGNVLGELGRFEEALGCYNNALSIDPLNAQTWSDKGIALGHLGRHREGLDCFSRAISIDPNDAATWYNKGNALHFLKRHGEAIQCYDHALEVDPKDPFVWHRRGQSLKAMEKAGEALDNFIKASELDPTLAPAFFEMAVLYIKRGWSNKARDALKKAVEIERHFFDLADTTPEFEKFRKEEWFMDLAG